MKELEGRVAIVTGSAMNIGRQICLKLARLGAVVVTHAKENRAGAEETADLVAAEGARAAAHIGDLSEPAGARALIEAAVREFGGLHILFGLVIWRRHGG